MSVINKLQDPADAEPSGRFDRTIRLHQNCTISHICLKKSSLLSSELHHNESSQL